MTEEKEFEVGVFIQEARIFNVKANSQKEAEDKYRAYLEEQGMNFLGVQQYETKGSSVTFRECMVINEENSPEIVLEEELTGEDEELFNQSLLPEE